MPDVRKWATFIEEIHTEMGRADDGPPLRRVAVCAVIHNPHAGRFVADLGEFVSLSYGEDLRELDSLQVVSVELPRTALAALGYPAVDSAATESVRAEVIVGHDGVARAIRFVD